MKGKPVNTLKARLFCLYHYLGTLLKVYVPVLYLRESPQEVHSYSISSCCDPKLTIECI